jgi:uroporphyrinogen-III decarboxylase
MASIRGDQVDRPPVSFYEISGYDQDPSNPSPFNVYNAPSWKPLLDLAREKTDVILRRGVGMKHAPSDPLKELTTWEEQIVEGNRITRQTVRAPGRTLTAVSKREPHINTTWTLEHLCKSADDLRAWIELPEAAFGGEVAVAGVIEAEERLGEAGIVMIDTGDPLCAVAALFDMAEYTIVAMTEQDLFKEALDKAARKIYPRVEAVAKALPGRVWRIYGCEYASVPYLPPRLHRAYFTEYTKPMVDAIQEHGGYARIHSHGNLRDILDNIAATGCTGLDPIEPPTQGDMTLREVKERVGDQMTLFGNLEVSDIETLKPSAFEKKVAMALEEGMGGEGRGFVLMPSACPYGREITPDTQANYELMVRMVEEV